MIVWDDAAAKRFPSLQVCLGIIRGIKVARGNNEAEALRFKILEKARRSHNLESLKDNPIVRGYRDLYWSLGIDPTKTRPSGEALLRRVLRGENLPSVSTVVDAYNLASLEFIIPLSGFDLDRLAPPFSVRFAKPAEKFHGIGMDAPLNLKENMLVLTDVKQVLCVYPYRDADATKITQDTRNALIVGYGAPNVTEAQLSSAVETALRYIRQVAGGEAEAVRIYPASEQTAR